MSDDPYAALPSKADDPYMALPVKSGETQRLRAMATGATFGAFPRIAAVARSTFGDETYEQAKADEYKKLHDYQRSHPWEAAAFDLAGGAPMMLIPGVGQALGVGRVAQAAQTGHTVARNLSTGQRVARAVGFGSEVGTVGAEVGAMGAKAAALRGAIEDPSEDVGHRLATGAMHAPLGYAGGRVINAAAERVLGGAGAAVEGMRLGSTAQARAHHEIRQRLAESGRTVDDAIAEILPTNVTRTIGPAAKEAILVAHGDAIAAGQTPQQARLAAVAAYRQLQPTNNRGQPLSARTMDTHARDVVGAYQADNTVPLLMGEVLHGPSMAKGGVRSLTAEVMNSPGGRAPLAEAVQGRQDGAIGRTRDLINDTFGRPETGAGRYNPQDYVGSMRAIEGQSRAMQGNLYGQARVNAQPINGTRLDRLMTAHENRVPTMFEDSGNQVQATIDLYRRWMGQSRNLSPAQALDVFKQLRGSVGERAGQLARNGDRQTAAELLRIRDNVDSLVRRRNPDWWTANNQTAGAHRLTEAADRGRDLATTEGRAVQEAKDWMTNSANAVERDAFRIGLGRKLHDKISAGDNHDVAKHFLTGGEGSADEGMRGLLHAMIPRDAERFLAQMERERLARATYGLDKGSQTASLQQGDKQRNSLLNMAISLGHGINPLEWLPAIGRHMMQTAANRRDAALGRILATSTDNPAQMIRALRAIQHDNPAQADAVEAIIRQVQALAPRARPVAGAAAATITEPERGAHHYERRGR